MKGLEIDLPSKARALRAAHSVHISCWDPPYMESLHPPGGSLTEENTNVLECSFILGKLQDFNNIQILSVGHTFIYLTYCKLLILNYFNISGFKYTPFANSTFSVHY